jgi:hypothetical protein
MQALSFESRTREQENKASEEANFFALRFNAKAYILLLVIIIGVNIYNKFKTDFNTPVTFQEAKERCAEKGLLLPITVHDLERELLDNNYARDIGYWAEDGKVLYSIYFMSTIDESIKKHYVKCVKVNNKQYNPSKY